MIGPALDLKGWSIGWPPMKITLGEMRSSGVCGLLNYCADYCCSHSIAIRADRWSDHVRLSDLTAKPAAAAAPTSGHCSNRHAWERVDKKVRQGSRAILVRRHHPELAMAGTLDAASG
jgi:hypothetical protein